MASSMQDDLLSFLSLNARFDLKMIALQTLLGMSASEEGIQFFLQNPKIIQAVSCLSQDSSSTIIKNTLLTLVNLSANKGCMDALMSVTDPPLVKILWKCALNDKTENADLACIILSNITCDESNCQTILNIMIENGISFKDTVSILCLESNDTEAKKHHLGSVLSNLSQIQQARSLLLDPNESLFQQLLPFITYMKSNVRRKGIVGTIRNCCFDVDHHEWLLSEDVDILPRLLYPLAGPEEFTDEEMAKLPIDLQYLGDDKEREPEPQIRQMLIEAINQLCATKKGREFIRENEAYLILRELHKWEKNPTVKTACENLVDVIISDEPSPEMQNLHELEIPLDLQEKFINLDAKLLENNE